VLTGCGARPRLEVSTPSNEKISLLTVGTTCILSRRGPPRPHPHSYPRGPLLLLSYRNLIKKKRKKEKKERKKEEKKAPKRKEKRRKKKWELWASLRAEYGESRMIGMGEIGL